ncbi:hypothetical protein SCATT_p06850 (plasmid) [Streptantibioticus cattleyicolor NRRL 8057 = DSM 46488]|uniref:Uncharacterized protein n=1 Tax=Streptantibioticus cattleyicolor (strain ATCC 35852 / DSM 46488 / JCM 4925 / NBRC 14057 / NRRL 8057) TaxID=1003195 RepID=G8XHD2_STREN|nr:hypothetical protein SCATT_p06850 [Streptantibioticus cattleyicolor NRRL 8057 = DSM 46488]
MSAGCRRRRRSVGGLSVAAGTVDLVGGRPRRATGTAK